MTSALGVRRSTSRHTGNWLPMHREREGGCRTVTKVLLLLVHTLQPLYECKDSAKYTVQSTENVQVYKHREKHYNAKFSTLDNSFVGF